MAPGKIVAITGANCTTAGWLIPLLKQNGYHTIGLVRQPIDLQTDEVISDWMNAPAARTVLESADFIVHLPGEINSKKKEVYIGSNVTTTRIVAECARKGNARRVIFLSYPGASKRQRNLYLHYKGLAEELLLGTGKDTVIFRCPVIVDSPHEVSRIDTLFMPQNGKAVPVIGDGQQRMHPVYRGDVAAAIFSALENGNAGVYELSGPETMTIDQFIQLVNQDPDVKIAHMPGWLALLVSRFVKGLSPTFVDIMLHHTDSPYHADVYREFRIEPTSLTALWSCKRRI